MQAMNQRPTCNLSDQDWHIIRLALSVGVQHRGTRYSELCGATLAKIHGNGGGMKLEQASYRRQPRPMPAAAIEEEA